jgi:hypothetical protein
MLKSREYIGLMALLLSLGTSAKTSAPPVLIAPAEGWNVTDYALSFTWQRQSLIEDEEKESGWAVNTYQIQVSQTEDFVDPIIDSVQKAPGQDPERLEPGDESDEASQEIQSLLKFWTEIVHYPPTLLIEGRWFWRVRGADEANQVWSPVVSFIINSDETKQPIQRELSASKPLFSFDMYDSDGGGWGNSPDWAAYYDFFPSDVRPFIAFAVPHEGWGGYDSPSRGVRGEVVTYAEFIQPLTDLGIPVLIKTGGPDGDPQNYLSPAELENLYRNHANVIGIVTGENTFQAIDGYDRETYREIEVKWLQSVIKISGKYGRFALLGEGAYDFAWEKYLGQESPANNTRNQNDYEWLDQELIANNRASLVPSSKTNIFWSQQQMDSAVFGASFSGLVENHGVWAEAWFWSDAGFSNGVFRDITEPGEFFTMPQTFWIQMMLKGVANGATFFHFGGESSVSENRGTYSRAKNAIVDQDGEIYPAETGQGDGTEYSSFWDMEGHSTLGFERYILPFIRAVTKRELISQPSVVQQAVKVAIDPGPVESDKGNFVCYGHYAALHRFTVGVENFLDPEPELEEGEIEVSSSGCRYDLIPSSGQFLTIPTLPHPAAEFDIGETKLVSIKDLQTEQAVLDTVVAAYPKNSEGDAWVSRIGDRVFVTNSNENRNLQQSFSVGFTGALVKITGNAMPHSYLLIDSKPADGSVWLHANAEHGVEYTDERNSIFELEWAGEPEVLVMPSGALIDKQWDAQTKSLKVVVSHEFGAVEMSMIYANLDSDGDGVIDSADHFPLDATETVDADADGIGNEADLDDDNDGFSDEEELTDGTDPLSRFSCRSGCFSFDVDENLEAQPLTDGLLVIRHLFGFSGDALISGAVSGGASRDASDAIASYLTDADSQLDIDGDGESKPLTDGLLLIRYLFGFSGDSLISGAIGSGADRDTAEEVEAYIEERVPAL